MAYDEWTNVYVFWKGQYTSRNEEYVKLEAEFDSRHALLLSQCSDEYWIKWLSYVPKNDILEEKVPCDNQLLKELIELQKMKISIDRKFPFASNKEDSKKILISISDSKFAIFASHARGRAFLRYKTIGYCGKDSNGFSKLHIDCNASTNLIMLEVRRFVEGQKYRDAGPPYPLKIVENNIWDDKSLKIEVCKHGAKSFRLNSDEARAAGLLLFDHIAEHGGTDAEAIKWVNDELKGGPKSGSSERQYQRWLTKTRACVEAAEVLEI